MGNDRLMNYLTSHLSGKRLLHCIGTAEEAVSLAKRYGADEKKAEVAGLLHDVGKGKCGEAQRYGLVPDSCEQRNPELTHGRLGMLMVKSELGIDDEEILSAIQWHTTGKAGMSILDKIIYIADIIEPGRSFEGVEQIRGLAYIDIDAAMIKALELVMAFVRSKGFELHPKSVEALEFLKESEERKKLGLS